MPLTAVTDYMRQFDELDGSPEIDFSRKDGSATRTFLVPEDAVPAILENMLPPSVLEGQSIDTPPTPTYPGFPQLSVDRVKFSPMWPDTVKAGVNANYDFVKAVITYKTTTWDQNGTSSDGPGGSQGSTGQAGKDQATTYVSHKVTIGGEFLTWPSACLQWLNPADPTAIGVLPSRQTNVNADAQVGIVIPTIEHSITLHYVVAPNWKALRQLLGRTNAYWFAGAAPGTLLFLGGDCSREITNTGARAWTMALKFSEKNLNAINPANPYGWSHFLRPDGAFPGTFQLLQKRSPGGQTALSSSITSGALTALVKSSNNFPSAATFLVTVDNEDILVPNGTVNSTTWGATTSIVRAINGTTAVAHTALTTVQQSFRSQLAVAMTATQQVLFTNTLGGVVNFNPFPTDGRQFTVKVDNEYMAVLAAALYVSGASIFVQLNVLRGVQNTVPATHAIGAMAAMTPGPLYDEGDFRYLFTPSV